MTLYKVFRKVGDAWEHAKDVEAHSADGAIRQVASEYVDDATEETPEDAAMRKAVSDEEQKEAPAITYAATPDGSWTERTVKVEVQTRVRFTEEA